MRVTKGSKSAEESYTENMNHNKHEGLPKK
jgi:hypothetical protein